MASRVAGHKPAVQSCTPGATECQGREDRTDFGPEVKSEISRTREIAGRAVRLVCDPTGVSRVRYWNPSEKAWQAEPYIVKEHSVQDGSLLATVVVVPMRKRGKKADEDEDDRTFVPTGVRIEETAFRKVVDGRFVIPGPAWFYSFSTQKISKQGRWGVRMHLTGPYLLGPGRSPEMLPPTDNEKGEPADEHRARFRLMPLVAKAKASYAQWREAKRQAA